MRAGEIRWLKNKRLNSTIARKKTNDEFKPSLVLRGDTQTGEEEVEFISATTGSTGEFRQLCAWPLCNLEVSVLDAPHASYKATNYQLVIKYSSSRRPIYIYPILKR